MTDSANTALSVCMADAPVDLIRHKIGSVHRIDGPESAGLIAMEVGGKGLALKSCLGAV